MPISSQPLLLTRDWWKPKLIHFAIHSVSHKGKMDKFMQSSGLRVPEEHDRSYPINLQGKAKEEHNR